MTMEHLFDVTLSTYGDAETREFKFGVEIVTFDGRQIADETFLTRETALAYAEGAITEFMQPYEAK